MPRRLLIVDDVYSMRMILQETMASEGYQVYITKNGREAKEFLDENKIDLVITDLVMPEINGLRLLEIVKGQQPDVGFLLITAYGTIEKAVQAIQVGAFDFITKPFSPSHIKSRVRQYFGFQSLREENKKLKQSLTHALKYKRLVGESTEMEKIYHQIDIVSGSDVPVFIEGESGTGKELIAQAVHDNSPRSDNPFLKVNCSAIPDNLFESTLFGHEKGSFTGAFKQHKGLFEDADGGTLLLDEINELPPAMQAKLLRVLQERTINRIGNTRELKVDVRIIATTNSNIKKLVEHKKFREDLYFRIHVFPIKVPSLRQRVSDIPLLINHFLEQFRDKYKYDHREISDAAMDKLMKIGLPGNVRQLENLIERAILYAIEAPVLEIHHFGFESETQQISTDNLDGFVSPLADMERIMIMNALKKTDNNRTRAAKLLGITPRTLRNKLHEYSASESVQPSVPA